MPPRLAAFSQHVNIARRRRVMEMRSEGATYDTIARELGVTRARVGQLVKAEMRRPAFLSRPEPPPVSPLSDLALRRLFVSLDYLPMTVRAWTVLTLHFGTERAPVAGDLASMPASRLLRIRGLGRTTLKELDTALWDWDLRIGLVLPQWPLPGLEPLSIEAADSLDVTGLRAALSVTAPQPIVD